MLLGTPLFLSFVEHYFHIFYTSFFYMFFKLPLISLTNWRFLTWTTKYLWSRVKRLNLDEKRCTMRWDGVVLEVWILRGKCCFWTWESIKHFKGWWWKRMRLWKLIFSCRLLKCSPSFWNRFWMFSYNFFVVLIGNKKEVSKNFLQITFGELLH